MTMILELERLISPPRAHCVQYLTHLHLVEEYPQVLWSSSRMCTRIQCESCDYIPPARRNLGVGSAAVLLYLRCFVCCEAPPHAVVYREWCERKTCLCTVEWGGLFVSGERCRCLYNYRLGMYLSCPLFVFSCSKL